MGTGVPPAVKPRPAANMNRKRASQLTCGHLVCIREEIAHLSDTSNCSDNRAVTHAYIVQVHLRFSFHYWADLSEHAYGTPHNSATIFTPDIFGCHLEKPTAFVVHG